MEKLIELLNEYKGKEERTIECGCPHNDWYGAYTYEHEELIIISKKFGFIQRLVENEKIDLGEKLFNLTKADRKKSIICDLDMDEFSWEDTFLMLLSISDTPIDDLILFLK